MKKRLLVGGLFAAVVTLGAASSAFASSNSNTLTIPGSGNGTITSNAWRDTGNGSVSGNTRQWTYQVSGVYAGSRTVQRIRSTWWAGASLRTSASLNLGISDSGVSVGVSSSWENVTTPQKYWENTNGAKSSSWRTNMIVAPQQYYQSNTIFIANSGLVKLSIDPRTFQISASA